MTVDSVSISIRGINWQQYCVYVFLYFVISISLYCYLLLYFSVLTEMCAL